MNACNGEKRQGESRDLEPDEGVGLDLDWSMRRDGDHLRIEYQLINRTGREVWIHDRFPGEPAEAVIVRNADQARTIAFTKDFVYHEKNGLKEVKLIAVPTPTARRLAPGGVLHGVCLAPTPLRSWLDYATLPPLEPGASYGVFEIGYCIGSESECTWRDDVAGPEKKLARPLERLRSDRRRLPEGAASWIPMPPTPMYYQYLEWQRTSAIEPDAGR